MSCEHCFRKVECKEKVDNKNWCRGCVPGTHYISYPECKEYYSSGQLFRVKPETIPASPPWTTWNGIIQCEKKSKIGQWLLQMDPHCQDIQKDNTIFVRGLWTASKSPTEYCVKL